MIVRHNVREELSEYPKVGWMREFLDKSGAPDSATCSVSIMRDGRLRISLEWTEIKK